MADHSNSSKDTKEPNPPSCSSPRPMAFTVDFGPSEGEQEHKKLALRDSIGRFAPAKIKQKIISKENTNLKESEVIILDEENNIKNHEAVEPAVSDAGTYTIDEEEDVQAGSVPAKNDLQERDKEIHRAFGIPPNSDKVNARDWVSVWASNSFAEDNPIQEEVVLDDIDERSSSSQQRRRLPATPLRQNGYQHKDNHVHEDDDDVEDEDEDTNSTTANEYLRDTISLMTAMEARISSAEENIKQKEVSSSSALASRASASASASHSTTPSKRRPKVPSAEVRRSSANNSAAAKAKEAKEKAAQQWQRRKNYDPLKSMAKARSSSLRPHDQYTDESSDVESAASFSQRGGPGLTNPRVALIRSDGGRHSLRHKEEPNHQHQGPQSLGSPLRRPPFKTNVMSQNGGRSTSSLSSKEAEFQAWKRRKNYNPMRSATASATSSRSATGVQSRPQQQQGQQLHASQKGPLSKANASHQHSMVASAPEDGKSMSQMHKRSASFHYPDGTSRVTHSVYSSEEDFNDEEDDDEEPRLYEVNDDELFLAYDSGGVVAPRRAHRRTPPRGSGGAGSTSSTQSGSKLEALDNLVISTIFSVSTKLCLLSGKLVKSVQERTNDKEEEAMLQTLLYVLEDIDPPVSPSKKTSRELAGTLRNLKKVEQALQTLERSETDL